MSIVGNTIGVILKNPNTIILRDSDGKEYAAAMTNEEVVLTATTDDVREGKTVATQRGVETGEKFIPSYHTYEGFVGVPNGSTYTITALSAYDLYDFTKMQAIFCDFNTSITDSVSADKISVYEKVHPVQSVETLSTVIRNRNNKTVEFGLTNDTGKLQIVRFFTYKEI